MGNFVLFNEFTSVVDGPQLIMAREVLRTFDRQRRQYDINEILQLYAILRYIESDQYSVIHEWTAKEKQEFAGHRQPLLVALQAYAQTINAQNFIEQTDPLHAAYHQSFLQWFSRFHIFATVSGEQLMAIVQKHGIAMRHLLAVKDLVKRYPDLIKVAFLDEPRNSEILADAYLRDSPLSRYGPPIHLPRLADAEKIDLVQRYVDGPNISTEHLRLFRNMPKTSSLPLPPKLKLKIARLEEHETKVRGHAPPPSYRVTFSNQGEPVAEHLTQGKLELSYSKPWLEAHTDHPTILQNFIYLFGYIDSNMRLQLHNFSAKMGLNERYLYVKAHDNYDVTPAFTGKQQLADAALWKYYQFLDKRGIHLEQVLTWFFTDYVSHHFSVNDFIIAMPSKHITYKERCHILTAEMEGILQQFTLLTKEGVIDPELLALSAEQIRYAAIPSLIANKYIYAAPENPEIGPLLFLMFYEHNGLGYMDKVRQERNLFWLILRHNIYYADFILGRNKMIDRLMNAGLLQKGAGGRLAIGNEARVRALYSLNEVGFLSYYRLEPEEQAEVNILVKNGLLTTGSTLLATPEAAYFNYYLNKAQFANGPNIRNLYSHGATFGKAGEDLHQQNFITLLKLLVIIVIKINDELCIRKDYLTK